MNPTYIIISCIVLVFLFIIYIFFSAQGIDIFGMIYEALYGRASDFFVQPIYLLTAVLLILVATVSFIVLTSSSGK